ncbi:MAG: ABC-F family ATP-binding cassette domain-containing protein [Ruminiclostridium sp.]|nr:ABC-F family ATP-binding cassette domain-containing protein [Ruminiclostridium sp.]
MIRAENLSFGFADKDLYHTISFTLEAGRHCALIGSNGTGKTTLADLIRRPENYLFDGTLETEGVGRIGFVSQFASREKDQEVTVFQYLSGDFLRLQEAIDDVCARMEETEDLDALLEEYQVLLDESESMDADNYETNIRRQLHLAELTDKADLELSKLSGGEYKLIQVIRQMLLRPGLLVMDEPDVFLDFENLNGLRDLVNAYEGTLLVITHSRYLLAHCFDKIWHLENADLQEFDGNFREYNLSLLQKKIDLQEAAAKDLGEIQRVTELVERLRDEATKIVDPLKGRTLKGKVSYLERLQARQIKAPFVEIRQPEITLPLVERNEEEEPKVLLEVNDYSLAFSEKLLENVSFTVSQHQKVAIVGPNGTGKTTLLRQLWQNENPAIRFHPDAKVGFFSQLQEERLNENNSIYQEFYEAGVDTPAQVEALLARYCFDPDSLGKKIGQLSGGEKNLLQLAKLSISGADLLLLDEPSSHLDTYAQMALEEAVANYQGAVLMVSHDFYSIVNCADAILYVDNGTIRPMSGRAFRKMIYKRHFSREYLELELKKSELETKVARCLEAGDWETAKVFFEALAAVVEQM